jgi:hypothetical protein
LKTVAVVAALVGALFFGIASVADALSTKQVKTERALSPAILLDLVRQPLWLMGILANLVGFVLQVVALSSGSLALVQPLLVFDLVFAVLIIRFVGWDPSRFPPGTRRWDPVLLAGVGAAAIGVGGFLAIGQPTAGRTDIGFSVLLPLAIGLVVVVGSCLTVAARNQNLRPLALALACGACYGVAAFSVKIVTSEFGSGPARVFTNWPIYMLAIVAPVGFILNQDAFQQGTFLAPVQSIVTTADPVISIGLSLLWLGTVLRGGAAAIAGEVVSLLIMTAGVIITAHRASPARQALTTQASAVPCEGTVRPGRRAAGDLRGCLPPAGGSPLWSASRVPVVAYRPQEHSQRTDSVSPCPPEPSTGSSPRGRTGLPAPPSSAATSAPGPAASGSGSAR